MPHAITVPPTPIRSDSGLFTVHQVPAASDNVVWLIEYEPGLCAAVDGPSAKEALEYCNAHGLRLTTILNTHTHGDHIGINKDLGKRQSMEGFRVIGARQRQHDIPYITETVVDGDRVALGKIQGRVWLTEGHIDGHVCFIFEDFLFCGDTLFAGGCGYLFDGPPWKMHASLQRLAELPPTTKVCCAHEYTQDNLRFAYSVESGNQELIERISRVWMLRGRGESSLPSTIGEERATNPFIRVHSEEIKESLLPHFEGIYNATPAQVFACTRKHKDSRIYRKLPEPEIP